MALVLGLGTAASAQNVNFENVNNQTHNPTDWWAATNNGYRATVGSVVRHEGQTLVEHFSEKPQGDGAWINAGYFVLEPSALDGIEDDASVWEQAPLRGLAHDGQLEAFQHEGFWQPMDTLRDKQLLEDMLEKGRTPWLPWTTDRQPA